MKIMDAIGYCLTATGIVMTALVLITAAVARHG
jgi:hypothetical protein